MCKPWLADRQHVRRDRAARVSPHSGPASKDRPLSTLEWLDEPNLPARTALRIPGPRSLVTVVDRFAASPSLVRSRPRRLAATSRDHPTTCQPGRSAATPGPVSESPAHESSQRSRADAPRPDPHCCLVDPNCHPARRHGETPGLWRGVRRATAGWSDGGGCRVPTPRATP